MSDETIFANRKNHLPLILRWTGTILALAILVYLFCRTGWEEILTQVKQLSGWRIAACLILIFISRLATWGRWHTLLVAQQKLRWQDSLKLTFAGLFASNVLPTTIGGDVARLAGAMRMGVDGALAAASLVADRLVGMTGMALAAPFALPALLVYLGSKSQSGVQPLLAAGILGKIRNKVVQAIKGVFSNLRYWLRKPLVLLKALGFTFIHMLCTFLVVKILIEGMSETLPFNLIAGIWSLTYFITLLPISIAGLGVQEVTITNLYSLLGGLNPTTTLSLAVILRGLQVIGSLPGVFFLSGVMEGERQSPEEKTE